MKLGPKAWHMELNPDTTQRNQDSEFDRACKETEPCEACRNASIVQRGDGRHAERGTATRVDNAPAAGTGAALPEPGQEARAAENMATWSAGMGRRHPPQADGARHLRHENFLPRLRP